MHTEVERFLEINTEKISDNKYLCPLSGKKFKGPEFVRKHIFNKHMDKVEAVKKEVWSVGQGKNKNPDSYVVPNQGAYPLDGPAITWFL